MEHPGSREGAGPGSKDDDLEGCGRRILVGDRHRGSPGTRNALVTDNQGPGSRKALEAGRVKQGSRTGDLSYRSGHRCRSVPHSRLHLRCPNSPNDHYYMDGYKHRSHYFADRDYYDDCLLSGERFSNSVSVERLTGVLPGSPEELGELGHGYDRELHPVLRRLFLRRTHRSDDG